MQVEGGKIDLAHHANYAKMALVELSDFEDAIQVAFRELKMKETLLIVTADHSHAFTLNGYPKRGTDILGFANQTEEIDPYETLSYANGPGFLYHRINDSRVNETWRRVEDDTTRKDPYYRHFAGKYLKDETHGGEDVALYAIGKYFPPHSLFLFSKTIFLFIFLTLEFSQIFQKIRNRKLKLI